jgi:hypothetical protein
MRVGERVMAHAPAGELAQDAAGGATRSGVDEDVIHQVRVEEVSPKDLELVDPRGELAH